MMISQLTTNERQTALVLLIVLAVVGLVMAAGGRDDVLSVHGGLVMIAALAGIFGVISGYYSPEPAEERLTDYYDTPSKIGIVLAMGWAAVGMFFGVWVAA